MSLRRAGFTQFQGDFVRGEKETNAVLNKGHDGPGSLTLSILYK